MSRNPHQSPSELPGGSRSAGIGRRLFSLTLHAVLGTARGLWHCLRALQGRRFAVTLLIAVIALELVVLGIGVTRRLDAAYRMELDLMSAQLAQEEARALAQGLADTSLTEGSAGIGAATAPTQPTESSDEAPPLRPRDVQTIIEQETAGWSEADDPVLNPSGNEAAGDAAADAQGETPDGAPSGNQGESPAPAAENTPVVRQDELKAEDAAELDRLIRQGVAAMTAGDMRRCVLSFEQAHTISPEHPALLYYYGLAYDKLLNPDRARQYYMKLFQQRDRAGRYFERASRRLTYGFEQPSAMRGKLAFGPHQVRHSYDEGEGERVSILLPVLLAPGEEVRPDDLYVTFQAFDLVNGRNIEFARFAKPQMAWENATPTWADWEENLRIEYAVPPLTQGELDAYGDLKYYGFTAKLYYKGEPLDCISSPSALILQEQRLLSRRANRNTPGNLLPDDGLEAEEAMPATDFLNEIDSPLP